MLQCEYDGIAHRRRILLAGCRLVVLDEVEGPGTLECEQIWQLGPGASRFSFASTGIRSERDSWYSPGYGLKLPGHSLVIQSRGESRVEIATTITAGNEGAVPSFAEAAGEIDRVLSHPASTCSR